MHGRVVGWCGRWMLVVRVSSWFISAGWERNARALCLLIWSVGVKVVMEWDQVYGGRWDMYIEQVDMFALDRAHPHLPLRRHKTPSPPHRGPPLLPMRLGQGGRTQNITTNDSCPLIRKERRLTAARR